MISFEATPAELELIGAIAKRAVEMAAKTGVDYNKQDAVMDITAANANACKLDLQKLLDAPNFDFAHDVFGIRRHLNRKTGALENCFLPRCAMPEKAVSNG